MFDLLSPLCFTSFDYVYFALRDMPFITSSGGGSKIIQILFILSLQIYTKLQSTTAWNH